MSSFFPSHFLVALSLFFLLFLISDDCSPPVLSAWISSLTTKSPGDFIQANGFKASLVAQMVKLLPAVLETRVRSLGWEDPLEKEMETHSSTLAWKIPWTEEPGRLQSMGSQRVRLHFNGFKYHLYVDESQIYISIPDLHQLPWWLRW